MRSITVKSAENMQQLVVTSGNEFFVDEPKPEGDGLAPSPYELLLASIAT